MLKRLGCLFVVSSAALLALAGTASAANFTVNDLGDAHDAQDGSPPFDGTCDTVDGTPVVCTLRAAIDEANAAGGTNTITISVPGQIDLTNGVLLISSDTEVDGNAGGTTVDAGASSRVFSTGADAVTLADLTVQNGSSNAANGAGIFSNSTQMTLNRVTVTGNVLSSLGGDAGGGIATGNGAALTLNDSTVSGNSITGLGGLGGGIRAGGPLTVTRSTVSGNSSTLDDGGRGGGIDVNITSGTAAVTITNSTISGNHAGGNAIGAGGGGGIFATSAATPVTISSTTIAGNTTLGGGGGAVIFASGVTTKNSIYALNTDVIGSPNCSFGATPSAQNNIDGGSICGFGTGNGNQEDVSSGALALGALADNGGLTQTRALGSASVARDAATDCAGLTEDQRTLSRPAGSACDIGAFEFRDADADAVEDAADNCPSQVGPASNGGCPLPVTPPASTPTPTPAPAATSPTVSPKKHCKKGQKLKKGKCVKKKHKR